MPRTREETGGNTGEEKVPYLVADFVDSEAGGSFRISGALAKLVRN